MILKKWIPFLLLLLGSHLQLQAQLVPIKLRGNQPYFYFSQLLKMEEFCLDMDEGDSVQNFRQAHSDDFTFYRTKENDTLALFNGYVCAGFESKTVIIFKMEKGKPTQLFWEWGYIPYQTKETIQFHHYPCCSSIINIVTTYALPSLAPIGKSHVVYCMPVTLPLLEKIRNTDLPKAHIIADCRLQLNEMEIDSHDWIDCPDPMTNESFQLKSGLEVELIETNQEGMSLIRIKNVKKDLLFCTSKYDEQLISGPNFHLLGWVESENLRLD